jgi:capsular polysaccharide biosynthesis protein
VQLTREREILQQQYGEIQSKLRNAQMSENLESEAKGERYTLIRKASVPFKPDSPNRLGIVMLGFVLGGALAVGMAVFRESTDPTVRATHDVYDVSSLPLLGAIPSIANPADRRRKRLLWTSVASAYAMATVGVAIAVIAS